VSRQASGAASSSAESGASAGRRRADLHEQVPACTAQLSGLNRPAPAERRQPADPANAGREDALQLKTGTQTVAVGRTPGR
jgi:hypothetical protein